MPSHRFKLNAAAYIILEQNGQILLARRCNTGFQDGKFSLVSGHLEGDEPASAAIIREVREEIGLELDPQQLHLVYTMHRHSPDQGKDFEYVDFFFRANGWQGEPAIMEPEKCDQLAWFPPDQLPENTVVYIKDVLAWMSQGRVFTEYGWPS